MSLMSARESHSNGMLTSLFRNSIDANIVPEQPTSARNFGSSSPDRHEYQTARCFASQNNEALSKKEVALPNFDKNDIKPGSRVINQGSKFKLKSKETTKNVVLPTIGTYNIEKADNIIMRKSPHCLILKNHEIRKPLYSPPPELPSRLARGHRNHQSMDELVPVKQQARNVEGEFYRLMHSNSSARASKQITGESVKNDYLKFSLNPITDDPTLMKFNTIMLRGMDQLKKDLLNFKLKINSLGLKSSNTEAN